MLDRESNAFSSRAIMLLLPGWRRADRRYIGAVGEERELLLSSKRFFFLGEKAFFAVSTEGTRRDFAPYKGSSITRESELERTFERLLNAHKVEIITRILLRIDIDKLNLYSLKLSQKFDSTILLIVCRFSIKYFISVASYLMNKIQFIKYRSFAY